MGNSTLTPKQRPPYLLGLLCLLPLIGALVGIALLLYAILRYKDKWLAIIGIFGIVWTIAIYSFLFLFITKSDTVRSGFEPLSRSEMNQLVADIELYKLQSGHYPDSLRQLLRINAFASLDDPLQTSRFHHPFEYHYKRQGDKYYLFSAGADGIPFTKDDLYPAIVIPDSSKIGLVRPN